MLAFFGHDPNPLHPGDRTERASLAGVLCRGTDLVSANESLVQKKRTQSRCVPNSVLSHIKFYDVAM